MKRPSCSTFATAFVLAAAIGLSACTSTQEVLELSIPAPDSNLAAASAVSTAPTATAASMRLQFSPVIGAPATASTPLAARLSASAAEKGITLIANEQPSATHIMKGYFSAITDGGQTTVIYVWDLIDPAGARVHRIQGQARTAATSGEGWEGVPAVTMETIADETVSQLVAWLATQHG